MCDVRKYSDMFKDMKTLQPEDTLQLIMETKPIYYVRASGNKRRRNILLLLLV